MSAVSLFSGGLTRWEAHGQWTGIYKRPVEGRQFLTVDGLADDRQADRRVHGGPDKALHQYPVGHYVRLATLFPTAADHLVVGSIGENVSAADFDERGMCIGDIFLLGEARLQVSQPRSPCWKIDQRYQTAGMAKAIAEHGWCGWYFRVLDEAWVASGDELVLVERPPSAVPLAELWATCQEHRPDPAALDRLASTPGLSIGWQKKLRQRQQWLRTHAPRSDT
ncbi:MAG TPA: MOSC domain-containing protein [Accumulibacter sp.]|nr:MOSC domain-containing protein [Accumulibacter sp.]HMW18891.1 MOSC domain-containing protein [Accumulibacter sp.]HMY07606.1 MOSC domain-containing protein [Accumulibacter sp.]HND81437.1 MOSC domain-containing protein [Accumulibacter sp.]HNE14082.1 MOSC domain-containing protein [Accumulibacter sp.]